VPLLSNNDAHSLAASIARGRAKVAEAQARGQDTAEWERHLAALDDELQALILPPIHAATGVPGPIPVSACRVCGNRRWRAWCDEEGTRWEWLCYRCHPLVVINPDGTRGSGSVPLSFVT